VLIGGDKIGVGNKIFYETLVPLAERLGAIPAGAGPRKEKTMKLTRWSEARNKGMTPKRIAKADALVAREALNIRLRTLREAAGLTQAELAKRATLTQSQLSRLEASANVEMRSILRYAQAAGADRVEITAVLGAKHIPLAIMGMTDVERDKLHERKYGKPVKTSPSSVRGRKGGSEAR
jgi:transcriptional regulator with XRE-family HTH domain